MLKLSDLADRADIEAGSLNVSPSRRLIEGPAGSAHLEPIVMKVFLLLLDASGDVVTRDELFGNAWGGVFVGDDSLNRAITRLRKAVAKTAPGYLEIEAIPRTGYRLKGEIQQHLAARRSEDESGQARSMPRRALVGGGLAAIAALGTGGIWWAGRTRPDPRFNELMARGESALRLDEPASRYFDQAVAIEPKNARAWGLLAYALANGGIPGSRAVSGPTLQDAERAARTAFDIDPNEPNALLAMTFVESGLLGWFEREERLRRILSIDSENTLAMRALGLMLHGAGRCGESLAIGVRALAIEPLSPGLHFRKVLELWSTGRVVEADRDLDRAIELWPFHVLVRLARLMIYAFTGRSTAALALIDEEEKVPIFSSKAAAIAWRTFLIASETRSASAIEAARRANIDGSRDDPSAAASAILMLSSLGDLDSAFDVANGFFLGRGSDIISPSRAVGAAHANGSGWRNTNGLFQPPTKAMRLDRRFKPLADGLGLTEYWRKRGVVPDAFLFKA